MNKLPTTLVFSLLLTISVFAQSPTDRIQRSGGKIQVVNDGSIVVTLASGKTFKITPQASLPVTCIDGQFAFKTNTGLHQCVNGAWLQLTSGSASAVTSFNTRTGVVTLSSIDVTDALTYTPVPPTRTVNGHALSGNVTVSKSDVGLGNADNTSDANKPVSTATQTALDLKENVANKSTDIAGDANSNTKYPAVKPIKDYVDAQIAALPVGVTNSAGADVVPVSDGTNLGANGTDVTLTASNSINNITPQWATGSASTAFKIGGSDSNVDGIITEYGNAAIGDGEVLIGDSDPGHAGARAGFKKITLTAGAGIGITNGGGSITIAADHTNLGTILGLPVNNTALATATGTVFSSPGNAGTPLSSTTEATVSFPCPRAGTLRNLFVRTGTTAKVNTPATIITIRLNGVDTAVTVTMTQTVSTTTSDTTHSATVVAGDLITVSLATTGAAAVSTSIAGVSFELD